jgi:hypothetical protein
LHRIVHECYLPLTRGLLERPRARMVVNISGALTDLLVKKGYSEVVDNLNQLAERGQIELTGSAKFHAFLPLLPETEVDRQIESNQEINTKYFGTNYHPVGFFSPEMAVSDGVVEAGKRFKFNWLAAADVGHPSGNPPADKLYRSEDLYIMFRHKRISSLMLSAVCRTAEDLIKETTDLHERDKYWFVVMDAETFGHHRIGHEEFLFEVLDNPFFEPVTVSDLLGESKKKGGLSEEETQIRPSTWTNEEQDFWLDREQKVPTLARSFILWQDPENPIHKSQWGLAELVINELNNYPRKDSKNYQKARELLDMALASDQFWWASAKPWWSLEMIEQGAYELKTVLITLDPALQSTKEGESLYREILDKAFEWQRTGYIRKKHLENSATFMDKPFAQRTPSEWYNQIILEFEDEMNKAADKKEFEKAVKWRDAVIKLKRGTDLYDVLHVVDELWSARTIPSVRPFLEHDWEEFSEFAKEYFKTDDQRSGTNNLPDQKLTKKDFEEWKERKRRGKGE